MIIHASPKRTKLLLAVRRLLHAQLRVDKAEWPDEAIAAEVTVAMREVAQFPKSKLRKLVASL